MEQQQRSSNVLQEICRIASPDALKVSPDSSMMPPGSSYPQVKCSDEGETSSSSGSWLLRVRARDDELKKYFGLPPSENLLDDFHCALRKRILLQGRMYVFDHYVCFYSNVLGFVKKRVILLKDVAAVKKKTNFRFPNSIEVEVRGQRRDFYTSFLSRDDAFCLIHNAWVQCRRNSNIEMEPGASNVVARSSYSLRRAVSHDSAGLGGPANKPLEGSLLKAVTDGLESSLTHTSSDEADKCPSYETDDCCSDRDEEEEEAVLAWCVEDREVPPVPKSAKLLVAVELCCSVRDFFDRIMSNDSSFFEDFHSSQGDRRVLLTNWRADEQMGHVRDLQFVSPIKGAFANWGTATTQCHQTQRFVVYPGDHVLFESSQVMTDIPYGDHFSVDTRWDVVPCSNDPARCSIKIHMQCVFTKKCMFRSIIESGSFKQTQDTFQTFFQQAKLVIAKPKPLMPISIRDKSFPAQQRNPSAPPTPKDRPGSPVHGNNASTSFSRPPSVQFMQATTSRPETPTPQAVPNSTAQVLAALNPCPPPKLGSNTASPQKQAAPLQLPPRSRTASREARLSKIEDGREEEPGGVVRSVVSGLIRTGSSAIQSMNSSPPLLLCIVALQLLILLLFFWSWSSPPPERDMQAAQSLKRLAMLQQEVKLLQLRMNVVTTEIAALASQLSDGIGMVSKAAAANS